MDASCNAKAAVVAVVGPTATGKTALGVALAQHFSGEVISADSMQIYKGLDVGTAKVTPQETCGIPHHGVDILTPEKTFSVADFTALAGEYIQDITGRGHLPLLVGGTGLYVQSLLYGVRFTAEKAPDGLREQLTAELEAIGPEAMYAKLQAVDPEAAAAIHPNNKVRVLRALEHYRATGKRLSEQKADSLPPERPYRSLVLGLDFPERAALYRRIDLRVDKMLEAGLLAEAEYVWRNREAFRTAAQAIGYKEFFPYFEQTAALDACTEKLKQAARNYAKRQLTWFRHMDGVTWLDAGAADVRQTALRLTQDFLSKGLSLCRKLLRNRATSSLRLPRWRSCWPPFCWRRQRMSAGRRRTSFSPRTSTKRRCPSPSPIPLKRTACCCLTRPAFPAAAI